jgi:hypothetical protein
MAESIMSTLKRELTKRYTLCLSIEKLTTSITEKLTTPSLSTSAVS